MTRPYKHGNIDDVNVEEWMGAEKIGETPVYSKFGSGESSKGMLYKIVKTSQGQDKQHKRRLKEVQSEFDKNQMPYKMQDLECTEDMDSWRHGMIDTAKLKSDVIEPMWNRESLFDALVKERQIAAKQVRSGGTRVRKKINHFM